MRVGECSYSIMMDIVASQTAQALLELPASDLLLNLFVHVRALD